MTVLKLDFDKLNALLPEDWEHQETLDPATVVSHEDMKARYADPVPPAGGEPEVKSARQYYYKVNACKSDDAKSPECICWHDEGTGPLFNNPFTKMEPKSWRVKPVSPLAGGEPEVVGYMPDSPDGEPLVTLESHRSYVAGLREEIKALCKHPSMSFHQVALLEGLLSFGADHRAHVTRLQAEVERLKAACTKEFESVETLSNELTKAREFMSDLQNDLQGQYPSARIAAFLSSHSAPADKDQSHEKDA